MSKRLVVIGGTAAGLSAASKAKRNDALLIATTKAAKDFKRGICV